MHMCLHTGMAWVSCTYPMPLCYDHCSFFAGLDTSNGLCCPAGLSEVLSHSFQLADARLLDYLAGKLLFVVVWQSR